MNEKTIPDSIAFGIIAVGLIIFVLISIVVLIMLSARRQKLKQELLQSQMNNQLLETQFAALRSQMNPHFIFNCLNSIRLFTEQNNGEAASHHLGKFSSFIRHTLDNARAEQVTLAEELNLLTLYLDLENLRFKQKVTYEIIVDDDVDKDFIEVPPLIIQPLAENAILHGLLNKAGNGHVKIIISYNNTAQTFLKIAVIDDGIGRQAADALKRQKDNERVSHGSKIIKERLALLHKDSDYQNNCFFIKDLYGYDGTANGTEVMLILPLT